MATTKLPRRIEHDTRLPVTLTPDLRERLHWSAHMNGRTMASEVRQALIAWLNSPNHWRSGNHELNNDRQAKM